MFKRIIISFIVFTLAASAHAYEGPVPPKKESKAGNYLTALEAFRMKMHREKGHPVYLIDIRSPSELAFVGGTYLMDKNIPAFHIDETTYDWNKRTFKMRYNKRFPAEFKSFYDEASAKDGAISRSFIFMCRSGNRSGKAINMIFDKYPEDLFYSVIDGFEGDIATLGKHKGERSVNGWRNSDLPWSYKLDKQALSVSD